MECIHCGRFTAVDHGPYVGEDAICCTSCWQELEGQLVSLTDEGRYQMLRQRLGNLEFTVRVLFVLWILSTLILAWKGGVMG